MTKTTPIITVVLFFTSLLHLSCTNKPVIKKPAAKIENDTLAFVNVTDSVLLALFDDADKAKEEKLFFEYYEIRKEFENIAVDADLLKAVENHYGELIANEFGKPKTEDFKIVERNRSRTIKNTRFSYTVLENNYAQNVPAYPAFPKIVLLYNHNNKLLTFIYCEDFLFAEDIKVVQSIRSRIITNVYEYDNGKSNFILKETHSREEY